MLIAPLIVAASSIPTPLGTISGGGQPSTASTGTNPSAPAIPAHPTMTAVAASMSVSFNLDMNTPSHDLEMTINNLIRFAEELGRAVTERDYSEAIERVATQKDRLLMAVGLLNCRSLAASLNANHD